jgi:hypothetical protein
LSNTLLPSGRFTLVLLAALTIVVMIVVSLGPVVSKAEAKSRCAYARAGGTVAVACGHHHHHHHH